MGALSEKLGLPEGGSLKGWAHKKPTKYFCVRKRERVMGCIALDVSALGRVFA